LPTGSSSIAIWQSGTLEVIAILPTRACSVSTVCSTSARCDAFCSASAR
jgi:hypothetical protein